MSSDPRRFRCPAAVPIPTFNIADLTERPNDWNYWKRRWNSYLSYTGISYLETNGTDRKETLERTKALGDIKMDALNLALSPATMQVIDTLPLTDSQKDSADDVIAAIDVHIEGEAKKKSIREQFVNRMRQSGESIDEYVKVLKDLCVRCRYLEAERPDDKILDVFLTNVNDKEVTERIIEQSDGITLEEALVIAKSIVEARIVEVKFDPGDHGLVAEEQPSEQVMEEAEIGVENCGNYQVAQDGSLQRRKSVTEDHPGAIQDDDDISPQNDTLQNHLQTGTVMIKEAFTLQNQTGITAKTAKESFVCDQCNFATSRSNNLRRHVVAVHDKSKDLNCPKCAFSTVQRSHLKRHLQEVHYKIKEHKCDRCDYRTARRSNFNIHVRAVHDKIKDYKCDKCDYVSGRYNHFKEHLKAVHDKVVRYRCQECDYETFHSSYLKFHTLNRHMKIRSDLKCDRCEFVSSGSRRELVAHVRSVHDDEEMKIPKKVRGRVENEVLKSDRVAALGSDLRSKKMNSTAVLLDRAIANDVLMKVPKRNVNVHEKIVHLRNDRVGTSGGNLMSKNLGSKNINSTTLLLDQGIENDVLMKVPKRNVNVHGRIEHLGDKQVETSGGNLSSKKKMDSAAVLLDQAIDADLIENDVLMTMKVPKRNVKVHEKIENLGGDQVGTSGSNLRSKKIDSTPVLLEQLSLDADIMENDDTIENEVLMKLPQRNVKVHGKIGHLRGNQVETSGGDLGSKKKKMDSTTTTVHLKRLTIENGETIGNEVLIKLPQRNVKGKIEHLRGAHVGGTSGSKGLRSEAAKITNATGKVPEQQTMVEQDSASFDIVIGDSQDDIGRSSQSDYVSSNDVSSKHRSKVPKSSFRSSFPATNVTPVSKVSSKSEVSASDAPSRHRSKYPKSSSRSSLPVTNVMPVSKMSSKSVVSSSDESSQHRFKVPMSASKSSFPAINVTPVSKNNNSVARKGMEESGTRDKEPRRYKCEACVDEEKFFTGSQSFAAHLKRKHGYGTQTYAQKYGGGSRKGLNRAASSSKSRARKRNFKDSDDSGDEDEEEEILTSPRKSKRLSLKKTCEAKENVGRPKEEAGTAKSLTHNYQTRADQTDMPKDNSKKGSSSSLRSCKVVLVNLSRDSENYPDILDMSPTESVIEEVKVEQREEEKESRNKTSEEEEEEEEDSLLKWSYRCSMCPSWFGDTISRFIDHLFKEHSPMGPSTYMAKYGDTRSRVFRCKVCLERVKASEVGMVKRHLMEVHKLTLQGYREKSGGKESRSPFPKSANVKHRNPSSKKHTNLKVKTRDMPTKKKAAATTPFKQKSNHKNKRLFAKYSKFAWLNSRYTCAVCGSSCWGRTSFRDHLCHRHRMRIGDYVERHGSFTLAGEVHQCHLCGARLNNDVVRVEGHLQGKHDLSVEEYHRSYMEGWGTNGAEGHSNGAEAHSNGAEDHSNDAEDYSNDAEDYSNDAEDHSVSNDENDDDESNVRVGDWTAEEGARVMVGAKEDDDDDARGDVHEGVIAGGGGGVNVHDSDPDDNDSVFNMDDVEDVFFEEDVEEEDKVVEEDYRLDYESVFENLGVGGEVDKGGEAFFKEELFINDCVNVPRNPNQEPSSFLIVVGDVDVKCESNC